MYRLYRVYSGIEQVKVKIVQNLNKMINYFIRIMILSEHDLTVYIFISIDLGIFYDIYYLIPTSIRHLFYY